MKILALSGSLRANSINSALLRAAARLAPDAEKPGMGRCIRKYPADKTADLERGGTREPISSARSGLSHEYEGR
ncbi:NAD(P)H-dependent oxidoreductase [Acidithiobacillus ferriphilus]|uniref:NAD(P)H-dependent oxidoreductase n=1 Tax=Acidithiobacillus ferriphilus TaxID=1689834 RepID=UPI00390C4F20